MARDQQRIAGSVAVVTGASRGIGRAVAIALAREGARVVATARSSRDLDRLVKEIRDSGGSALAVPGDVTQQQDIRQVIDRTLAEYGSIEILVNNAGIGILGPFGDAGLGDYEATMNVNLRSVFLFCHYVLPLMAKAGRGDVVNIASISGLQAFAGASLYCASKFATIGMTRALDNEYRGLGVRVSSVCPAGTRTQWAVGTGRTQEQANQEDLLSPETVANAVLFAIKQPENARMGELVLYPMSEPGWL